LPRSFSEQDRQSSGDLLITFILLRRSINLLEPVSKIGLRVS
jgi:hypothetical protein